MISLGGLLDDLGWEFVGEHHRRQDLIRFRMQDGRNVFMDKSGSAKMLLLRRTGIISLFRNRHWMQILFKAE